MGVTGLGWCGTRTSRDDELADFYEHVLGLRPVHAEPGLRVFELSDGRNVEVFGLGYPGREHFGPGPVVGFAVRDLPAAVPGVAGRGRGTAGRARPGLAAFPRPGRQRLRAHRGLRG